MIPRGCSGTVVNSSPRNALSTPQGFFIRRHAALFHINPLPSEYRWNGLFCTKFRCIASGGQSARTKPNDFSHFVSISAGVRRTVWFPPLRAFRKEEALPGVLFREKRSDLLLNLPASRVPMQPGTPEGFHSAFPFPFLQQNPPHGAGRKNTRS